MPERRAPPPAADQPLVFIIDDDVSMRESLSDLFQSMRFDSEAYDSTAAFLAGADLTRSGCILLDIRLPGINGLDFQAQLERMGNKMPVIFMTGYGDIPMTVRAMKAGAIDFLTKPFKEQDMLDAVATALRQDAERRSQMAQSAAISALADTLTPREREVMEAVVKGLMNKQIAFNLGISEVTVKLHRGNVMRKMDCRSVADLVRKAELLDEGKDPPVY